MQDLTRAVQRPVATKSKGRAQALKRATSMPVATREIVSGCKLRCGLLGCPCLRREQVGGHRRGCGVSGRPWLQERHRT